MGGIGTAKDKTRTRNVPTSEQQHREMLLRPPQKTMKQKCQDFIWNPENRTCLTRSPLNWFTITVYQIIFLVCVGVLFVVCLQIVQYVSEQKKDKPHYTLDNSPIGDSPGLNYFPQLKDKAIIWISEKNNYKEYVKIIDDEFSKYQKVNPKFSPKSFGNCSDSPYGYDTGEPCVFIRLNRVILWRPDPYVKGEKLPEEVPEKVKKLIETEATPMVWLSCEGSQAKDRDHITSDFFNIQGPKGFEVSNFPFGGQKNYVDSIVAMKLIEKNRNGILYSFKCTAWDKNIRPSGMSGLPSLKKKQRVLSETEKKILKEAFELFDSNNDGYLDYYEFKASSRCLGFHLKKPELLIILETYARCNRNVICYEDFYEVMEEKMLKRDPMDEIKEAFKLIANDKTNAITFRDLKHAAEKVGADIPDRDLRSMIEEFDTKGEGKLDEEDFINLITGESL